MNLINNLVGCLSFQNRIFGCKDKVFSLNASFLGKKKEAFASFFSQNTSSSYFTINFMVFSKPLALTVTK